MIIGDTFHYRVGRDGIAHPTKDFDSNSPFHGRCSPREIAIFLARNWGPDENGFAIGSNVPAGIRRTIEATPLRDFKALIGQDIWPTAKSDLRQL